MPIEPRDLCLKTEGYLHAQIPITRAMGVQVESYEVQSGRLVLAAPLEVNHNHLGTAFGGSLSALCILAGYALLWLEIGRENEGKNPAGGETKAHVVVKESNIAYRRPVKAPAIRVVCERPDAAVMHAFHRQFAQKGKARIQLSCKVVEDAEECVQFSGTYVAIR